jgi:RimJ/RimL family protein N-acetyltransferase
MISDDLFRGKLVRLAAAEPETFGKLLAQWGRDSVYLRQLDSDPVMQWSAKKYTAWIERDDSPEVPQQEYDFRINTLQDDRLIGFVSLFLLTPHHRDAWVGIGIGEPEYRGKGYGTDAMRVILRYAFAELNMHRVSLGLFAYNTRALHSYEKAGFKLEGRERGSELRDGQRTDMLYMGILKSEFSNAE